MAGAELLTRWHKPAQGLRSKSHPNDLVSEADEAAERIIFQTLQSTGEECRWWGEESGESGRGGWRWVVDPLDGTTDYLRGLPGWCVSIGGEDLDDPSVGVVFNPVTGEMTSAYRGGPVSVDGKELGEVSYASSLEVSLVALSPVYNSKWLFDRLWGRVGAIRAPGALALAIADCVRGKYDLVHYTGSFAWYDCAAGVVLARSAGLGVAYRGMESKENSELLVAPPHLYQEYVETIGSPELLEYLDTL
jgi:myo-inositol-1(or 4)-monophosphatase